MCGAAATAAGRGWFIPGPGLESLFEPQMFDGEYQGIWITLMIF
jgi:hypothetical protein